MDKIMHKILFTFNIRKKKPKRKLIFKILLGITIYYHSL